MKIKNPKTLLFYKRGDIADDGRIFWKYHPNGIQWAPNTVEFSKLQDARKRHHRFQSGPGRLPCSIAKRLLASACMRAKKSGGSVTISAEWILERLQKCSITNIEFVLPAIGRPQARSPSLDRIDSENLNYSPENTRLVLWQVNAALNRFSDTESLPILKALVEGLEKLT